MYLLQQPGTVLLNRLAPDESVLVGLGLYLRTVDILHVQTDESALGKKQHYLREHGVDLLLHAVTETVDGDVVGLLITSKPDEMDVTQQTLLYLAAGIDVVHVAVDHSLEHHTRMERTPACRLVQFTETCQVQLVNQTVNKTYWVVFRNIFVDSLRKKQNLLGSVRTKV